jgi:hypothetical protein
MVDLTRDDFERHIGDTFDVAPAGVSLRLDEVRALGAALRPGGGFALSFSGPTEPFLPQATYPLAHAGLGMLDIFIVPVGRDTDGLRYEAIFT